MEHPTDPLQMAVVLLLLLCSAGVSPDGKKRKRRPACAIGQGTGGRGHPLPERSGQVLSITALLCD